MDSQTLLFFDPQMEGLPLYEHLAALLRQAHPEVRVQVQKTQIAFSARFGFCWVWLPRLRLGQGRGALGLSLGLGRRLDSPRIFQAVEPYPGRWTHHLLLHRLADFDQELLAWLEEAYAFGCRPGRSRRARAD